MSAEPDLIDTVNHGCVVWLSSNHVQILNPPKHKMDPESALVFAAWIVYMADAADPNDNRFRKILDAVRNS